ncbi:hypothetical protein [Streptomyces sp. NPDC057854]|uniref:hypothetical protein n=1 Tax=unclassified Streptomyces TaxID=2593676 RepID=UPI00368D233C
MAGRTPAEMKAVRDRFIEARDDVTRRYAGGETMKSLAQEFTVSTTWAAETMRSWGVTIRGKAAAAQMRGKCGPDPVVH